MNTLVVIFLFCLIIYFVLSLIEKIDKQKKEIKQLQRNKVWDDFSYKLMETQLHVRDAIDQCRKMRSNNERSVEVCEKFLKDTETP